MSATPPSIAIEALVLGGPEVVRVVLNSSSSSSFDSTKGSPCHLFRPMPNSSVIAHALLIETESKLEPAFRWAEPKRQAVKLSGYRKNSKPLPSQETL